MYYLVLTLWQPALLRNNMEFTYLTVLFYFNVQTIVADEAQVWFHPNPLGSWLP